MDYKAVSTTAEVYAVIHASHCKKLKVFRSYSAPDCDHYGNPANCKMFTEWGIDGCEMPIVGSETTWQRSANPSKRINEKTTYWLCVGISEDLRKGKNYE